jgi:DNA-binding PadR family transcriptional regulator
VSTTRLLVLGTVRLFQPAHGYLIRRELLSWEVESWAAVNPGSIYNMLRSLTRDALLEEVDPAGTGGGPARVGYRLTMDGENAYFALLNKAFWEIDDRDPHLIAAALCFLPTLTRAQAAEALEAREAVLELRIKALEARTRLLADMRVAPPHTVEMFDYEVAHCAGELTWVRAARKRIAADHYRFRGEPGAEQGPSDGHWFGPLDKPGNPT